MLWAASDKVVYYIIVSCASSPGQFSGERGMGGMRGALGLPRWETQRKALRGCNAYIAEGAVDAWAAGS